MAENESTRDGQVSADIGSAMSFMDKIFAKVSKNAPDLSGRFKRKTAKSQVTKEKTQPSESSQASVTTEVKAAKDTGVKVKLPSVGGTFSKKLAKKIIRVIVGVLIITLVLFAASQAVNIIRRDGQQPGALFPSPTGVFYEPTRPSVYAEDEQVLKMEDDLRVLDREVVSTSLKESTLNPPILDFDIDFEE